MAWDVVSQTQNTVLPAARVNQLQDNFPAMAAQNSGAPVVTFPNSVLNANAGIGSTGVGSFGRLYASSGSIVPFTTSGGLVNATSGFNTAQVGSVGLLDASSGIQAEAVAPAAPIAGRFYKDTAIRAWLTCSADGSIYAEMGIASVANTATGIYVITLATSFSAAKSWCPNVSIFENIGVAVYIDQRSMSGGAVVIETIGTTSLVLANRGFILWAVGS